MSDLRALVESGLIDKEDGTIFDTTTKLLWQQSPSDKTFIWQEAIEYCKSLTLAGHSDWRLPTIEELESLINNKYKPTIDPIFKCKSKWYWSSSIDVYGSNYARSVSFYGGYVSYDNKDGSNTFVRAVRG
jgi:hypothetical protein